MRQLIFEKVRDAAELAGLGRDLVMNKSVSDNLTQPRPRLELQFLPETYGRSGRRLGLVQFEQVRAKVKKELYRVNLPVAAHVLAQDSAWLQSFCYSFIAFLPRGFNDAAGNYVELTASEGTWGGFEEKRVGLAVIEPIIKRDSLIHLKATWRITAEEATEMINGLDLKIGGFENGQE